MDQSDYKVEEVSMLMIHADESFNCRGKILPVDVHELATDIKERGLLQPVIVSPYPPEKVVETGCKYRLIAGFRRHTAHRVIQAKKILCMIRPDMTDEKEARLLNLTENTQREDLNVLQEARALTTLKSYGMNEFEIGSRLGKSRGWVQVRLILLKLPDEVQEEAAAGLINQTQIRELYTILTRLGIDAVFAAVKRVKHNKERGRKAVTLNPNKTSIYIKKPRERQEIFQMMDRMLDAQMLGLPVRALAWASGEITTSELFDDMVKYAEEHDGFFVKPGSL